MRSKLLLTGLLFAMSTAGYAQTAPTPEAKKAEPQQAAAPKKAEPQKAATDKPASEKTFAEKQAERKKARQDRADKYRASSKRDMSTNQEVTNQMSMRHSKPDKNEPAAFPTKPVKQMTPEERKDLQDRAQKASKP